MLNNFCNYVDLQEGPIMRKITEIENLDDELIIQETETSV